MSAEHLVLVPRPRDIHYSPGTYELAEGGSIRIAKEASSDLHKIAERVKGIIQENTGCVYPIQTEAAPEEHGLVFEKRSDLPSEGYALKIGPRGIEIRYSDDAGAFHAVSTFKQLVAQRDEIGKLPFLEVSDYPDFAARGIMLDISRDRIPTLETLYRIVDLIADLKLNQLQLYIEGFSYAYPSFPDVWRDRTPITPEEIRLLDVYCRNRFIDLVPNQNSFGHMTPWLVREEFNELSESPKGCMAPWGWYHPTTLNPLDPNVMTFLEKTYDDLLPAFSSGYFNVGCDETFELGQGRSKQQCEERGKGAVYLDFLWKLHELVERKGKKMMYWADIIAHYPELIPSLPQDAIALEWGYEADQPSSENCERLSRSGIPFYVCPGTSSWNSIAGLTDNMKANLRNAATLGKKFGAIGFLNTDWGSPNHWQHLPVSYPGFIYGAALSWGVDCNADVDVAGYLDRFVYRDLNRVMGRFALDLGNYYRQEKESAFDGSGIYRTLFYHRLKDANRELDRLNLPPLEREEYERVDEYVRRLRSLLEEADMQCDDAEWVKSEHANAIALILHGAKLGRIKHADLNEAERERAISGLAADLEGIVSEFERVWLCRNRAGGMKESLVRLDKLMEEYRTELHR